VKVLIGKRIWKMSWTEYQGLLQVAKAQVSKGIYAIEKGDYAELRNDKCSSTTKLKESARLFREQGFKVYMSGR